jgi:DNA-binding CsgD family transcriptional regulator
MLRGEDVKHAAQLMHIAEGTARFMLKTIFRKTGTNSQSALMRLLLSLPGETANLG